MSRKFGPKVAGHPGIGRPCYVCGVSLKEGDYTGLIVTEPAGQEERARAAAGMVYTAMAEEAHWDCMPEELK